MWHLFGNSQTSSRLKQRKHKYPQELDFWVLYNEKYVKTDTDYWTLLARFERFMDSPSYENNRRLRSTIKLFEEMGADADWPWEIYDQELAFLELKLWPWLKQRWVEIILRDFEFMEKSSKSLPDFPLR